MTDSEVAPAAAPATQVKAQRQRRGPKAAGKSSPAVGKLIMDVLAGCTDRRGMSAAALKKAVGALGYDVDHKSVHFKRALLARVKNGKIVQVTGRGASGSFKLAKVTLRRSKPVKKTDEKVKKQPPKKSTSRKNKPTTPKRKKEDKKKKEKKEKKTAGAKPSKAKQSPKKDSAKKKADRKTTTPRKKMSKKDSAKKKSNTPRSRLPKPKPTGRSAARKPAPKKSSQRGARKPAAKK